MILLWGTMDDTPLAAAHAALTRGRADFFFLDYRKIVSSEIDYSFDSKTGWRCVVRAAGQTIDMADVKVAYARGSDFRTYDEFRDLPPDSPQLRQAAWFEAQLRAWLDASDAVVINRSAPSATNYSKPYQMTLIRQAGFLVPEAFISNDPTAAMRFLSDNPETIYKSLSFVRSIVHRVEETHRGLLDDVKWCPTFFQRFVPGINHRVHVINGEVLAVRIESDRLDYRYGRSSITPAELPPEIAQRCRRLTAALGLYFSGIDLMRTPEEDWYCFEVNASPAYTYFEAGSGQPISVALADFMMDANSRPGRILR